MFIIRSEIFSQFPEIVFGMSTRQPNSKVPFDNNMSVTVGDDALNVSANRKNFFTTLGITEEHISFPMQEHTDVVRITTHPERYPHCDALVTDKKNLFLAVSVADCTPIMLFDPIRQIVAGIHAGWRGTSKRIVTNTLQLMRQQWNVLPEHIIAFIGPSAGICCYEVGEEVAQLFPSECTRTAKHGKYLLDVKKANLLELLANGVQESHIEVHPDCTIHNRQYHSFRRDGKQSGRMLAVIGMRE